MTLTEYMFSRLAEHVFSPPERDGRRAILEAALTQIANGGLASLRVQSVAATAGVSPPLVLHHLGSKAGLIEACDQHVIAVLPEAAHITEAGSGEVNVQSLLALPDGKLALHYVGRSLVDGGPVGQWWFDLMTNGYLISPPQPENSRPQAAGANDDGFGSQTSLIVDRALVRCRRGDTHPKYMDAVDWRLLCCLRQSPLPQAHDGVWGPQGSGDLL